MLTAIDHNHDFGIDTVLVPGTPVWIHVRVSGHGSNLREKEGTREEGGDKRREKEKKKKRKVSQGKEERDAKGALRVLRVRVEGVDGNGSALCNEALRATHLKAV